MEWLAQHWHLLSIPTVVTIIGLLARIKPRWFSRSIETVLNRFRVERDLMICRHAEKAHATETAKLLAIIEQYERLQDGSE